MSYKRMFCTDQVTLEYLIVSFFFARRFEFFGQIEFATRFSHVMYCIYVLHYTTINLKDMECVSIPGKMNRFIHSSLKVCIFNSQSNVSPLVALYVMFDFMFYSLIIIFFIFLATIQFNSINSIKI